VLKFLAFLQKIKDSELPFNGSESSLKRLIVRMGFKYVLFSSRLQNDFVKMKNIVKVEKTKDNRRILMETHDVRVRLKRIEYLNTLTQYRREGRNIVYTDETYIHASHTTSHEWSDGSHKGLHKPIAKGKRLIIS
jgi:hypothetical protein